MKDEAALKQKLADELYKIGNLVHQSVRVSKDEANNEIYRTWGLDTKKSGGELKHHHELLHMIGGYDPERGTIHYFLDTNKQSKTQTTASFFI
jgi:seryl-tRNA synthetase